MNKKLIIFLLTISMFVMGCVNKTYPFAMAYKSVSFDEFYAGQVVSLPLSIEIPVEYVHANTLKAPFSYAYWMIKSEIPKAARSNDLPNETGYIYGKLSTTEGYDQYRDRFTTEDQTPIQLSIAGLKLLKSSRKVVKGYPILNSVYQHKNGNLIYSVYVGTLIDTNVLYLAFRPPMNDVVRGDQIWDRIVESIR